MRNAPTEYEPVFGGIVAVLAAALVCFALFTSKSPDMSRTMTLFLGLIGARGIFWGAAQIVGYRNAKRLLGSATPAPLFGTALGCVSLGLMLAAVAVVCYAFAGEHPLYSSLSGAGAAILLLVGAIVGIRQGVWRGAA